MIVKKKSLVGSRILTFCRHLRNRRRRTTTRKKNKKENPRKKKKKTRRRRNSHEIAVSVSLRMSTVTVVTDDDRHDVDDGDSEWYGDE